MTGHRGGSARFVSADISESTLRFLRRAQYPLPCTQFIAAGVGRGGGGRERKGSSCKVGGLFLLIPVLLCLPLPFSAPCPLLLPLPSSASTCPPFYPSSSSASPCPPLPPPAVLCTFFGPLHPFCLCPIPYKDEITRQNTVWELGHLPSVCKVQGPKSSPQPYR